MRRILLNLSEDDDLEPGLMVDGAARIAGIFLPGDDASAIRLAPVRHADGNVIGLRPRAKTSGTA